MENNLDFAVGMTFIVLAILFIAIFFGVAWLKDHLAKRQHIKNVETYVDLEGLTLSEYAKSDLKYTMELYVPPVVTNPTATYTYPKTVARKPFFYGDFDFCNGAPLYNDLASQYNRKHA